MARVFNLDCQIEDLLANKQFSKYEPWGDPQKTSGGRLWRLGDAAPFWTPPALPAGLTRAVRLSPGPSSLRNGRPRSQGILQRVEMADPASGLSEPADGFPGTERWFVGYTLFPPDFNIPTTSFPNAHTEFYAWHALTGGATVNKPNIEIRAVRWPTNNDPMRLVMLICGGKSQYVSAGQPTWNWDAIGGAGGGPAYLQYRRVVHLAGPLETARWYKVVVHNVYGWDPDAGALTEVWIDGVKVLGTGITTVDIDPGNRVQSYQAAARDLGLDPNITLNPKSADRDTLPQVWRNPDGTVQQGRFAAACYMPLEGPVSNYYDPAVWDRAIWHTGMGFFTTAAEVQPTVGPEIVPPHPIENWSVYGTPQVVEGLAPDVLEEWSVLGTQQHSKLARRVGGAWQRLELAPPR